MRKYLISNEGQFYKANLHCHTTFSDGKRTPQEIKEIYNDFENALNNEEDVAEEFGEYNNGYKTYSILNDFINDYIQIIKPE